MKGVFIFMCCISVAFANACEPIAVPMCLDIGYNTTLFPNFLGHQKQEDAGLEIHQFYPLVRYGCSDYLKTFLCNVYVPECICSPKRKVPYPKPVSKEICERAKGECQGILNQFGFYWPENLNCDQFKNLTRDNPVTIADEKEIFPPTGEQTKQPSYSPEGINPDELEMDLEITYSPSAITFVSCCHVYSYSVKTFKLPTAAVARVKNADVRSFSVPAVTWKMKNKPDDIEISNDGYSTLIMLTKYLGKNSKPQFYLQWMVQNIHGDDTSSGITAKEYLGPWLKADTEVKVFFLLYRHKDPILLTSEKYRRRQSFDLNHFKTENSANLKALTYMVVEMDEYSRFKMVNELGKAEPKVCKGVLGYNKGCTVSTSSLYNILRK